MGVSGQPYTLAVVPQGKWRLGGLQIWSRHFGKEKSPLALLGIELLKYGMNVVTLIVWGRNWALNVTNVIVTVPSRKSYRPC
jgi:hypothetical protein